MVTEAPHTDLAGLKSQCEMWTDNHLINDISLLFIGFHVKHLCLYLDRHEMYNITLTASSSDDINAQAQSDSRTLI